MASSTPTTVASQQEQAPAESERLRPCLEAQTTACGGVHASHTDTIPSATSVPIGPDDPVRGQADAPVAVVVYSDFQCPYCARLVPVLEQLLNRHPERIRLVWKDLPSPRHPQATPAALLARQAFAERGSSAFWQAHDALFAHQSQLSDESLQQLAQAQGLTWPPPQQYQSKLDRSLAEAGLLGVTATPTTFVGDQVIVGAQSASVYESAIDQAVAKARP